MGNELMNANSIGNQLSTLDQQITKLGEELRPPRDEQVSARLMMLAKSGMAWPKTIDQSKAFEIYSFALAKIPYVGLKIATEKLVSGDYPEASKDFMPTPAALAALARREASEKLSERARLRDTRETLSSGFPDRNSPERMAAVERVRKLRLGFMAAHAESKTSENNPLGPDIMDDDRREYWRSIAALPDRPEITEEQRAFQRRVHGAIAAGEETNG